MKRLLFPLSIATLCALPAAACPARQVMPGAMRAAAVDSGCDDPPRPDPDASRVQANAPPAYWVTLDADKSSGGDLLEKIVALVDDFSEEPDDFS